MEYIWSGKGKAKTGQTGITTEVTLHGCTKEIKWKLNVQCVAEDCCVRCDE